MCRPDMVQAAHVFYKVKNTSVIFLLLPGN